MKIYIYGIYIYFNGFCLRVLKLNVDIKKKKPF